VHVLIQDEVLPFRLDRAVHSATGLLQSEKKKARFMKKIVTLLFAAGLVIGSASMARAIDVKVSGEMNFTASWVDAGMDKVEGIRGYAAGNQNNSFYQKIETQVEFIASESLRGVLAFTIDDTTWGNFETGGAVGADGIVVRVTHAFLDWIVPNTNLQLRMGLQELFLPGMDGATQVFGDDVAAVLASYEFTENVGLTAWWMRPFADNTPSHSVVGNSIVDRKFNELDAFGLAVPLKFEGVEITPWGQYAVIGRDFSEGYEGATSFNHFKNLFPRWVDLEGGNTVFGDGQGSGFWLGLTGDITLFDPFRFAWDFNYGRVDLGRSDITDENGNVASIDAERAGWYGALLVEYALDCVTPGLIFWYGSGDDGDWEDGSEMLPGIHAASSYTSFGQDGADMNFAGTVFQSGLAGTWGAVLRFNDLSFVEDLTHVVQFA
jgi:hypothetical protein